MTEGSPGHISPLFVDCGHFWVFDPQTATNMRDNHSYTASRPRENLEKRKEENGRNLLTGKKEF